MAAEGWKDFIEPKKAEMILALAEVLAAPARQMVGPPAADPDAMPTTASSAGSPPRSPLLPEHQPDSTFEEFGGFGSLDNEPPGEPACSNRLPMHSTAGGISLVHSTSGDTQPHSMAPPGGASLAATATAAEQQSESKLTAETHETIKLQQPHDDVNDNVSSSTVVTTSPDVSVGSRRATACSPSPWGAFENLWYNTDTQNMPASQPYDIYVPPHDPLPPLPKVVHGHKRNQMYTEAGEPAAAGPSPVVPAGAIVPDVEAHGRRR